MAKKENKNILDIIKGISQVMANAHDGAKDKDGEPIKMGLKREEGNPIVDSRIIDGVSARIQGENLIVSYQSDILLSDVHSKKFEENLEQTIEDVVSYIKKEYKSITGESISLKKDGEIKAIVQRTSNVRTFVVATCVYKIGGINLKEDPKAMENNFREWLKQTSKEAKRPSNEQIKAKDNERIDLKGSDD